MLIKTVSFVLVFLMINLSFAHVAFARDANEAKLTKKERKIQKRAGEVQKGVRELGVSKDSKVFVKLRDKTKITGHVSDIGDTDFTVVDQTGASHVIPYKNVKQVKGNNLSTGSWIAIGIGATIAVLLIIIATQLSR